ncbi:MAG: phage portal protein [Caulobacteraceae bacterium]
MNWLDRAIGFFSPRTAFNRASWREALRSYYDSGSSDRLNSGWTQVNATAEQTDQGQRDIIRARARDLERNSDIAEAIIGPYVRNVIGTGMKLQAKIMKERDIEDEELNQEIESLWEEWCRPRNCDITGQQSFNEMQQMAVRRKLVDGGIFFIKAYTNGGPVPFILQAREVDELDTTKMTLGSRNRIVGGIEFDQYNKPVAYWFKKYSPDGFYTYESERIEAQRVIYLWKKNRPTQMREISPMAKTLPRVRDINEFVEAVSVKERILACLSVFITKNSASGTLGRGAKIDEKSGYQTKTISPGMIHELQPGESVTPVNPSGQSSNAKEFIATQQRLAGSGQGLSYEAVSRDMSQVNYSSARQGLLEDQRTYMMEQEYLVEHFCKEVYTEFVISAVLSGKLNIKDFWQKKSKYLKHVWIPSGWSWIDPVKEVTANAKALETGQDTLSRICAERGEDWRDVLRQRAKEQQMAKELGITLAGGETKSGSSNETADGATAGENDTGSNKGN